MKTYSIRVFVPDCGAWFKIATFSFRPTLAAVDSVVRSYIVETISNVSLVRVYCGRSIIGDFYN